jgi:hypothetical protein
LHSPGPTFLKECAAISASPLPGSSYLHSADLSLTSESLIPQ